MCAFTVKKLFFWIKRICLTELMIFIQVLILFLRLLEKVLTNVIGVWFLWIVLFVLLKISKIFYFF